MHATGCESSASVHACKNVIFLFSLAQEVVCGCVCVNLILSIAMDHVCINLAMLCHDHGKHVFQLNVV